MKLYKGNSAVNADLDQVRLMVEAGWSKFPTEEKQTVESKLVPKPTVEPKPVPKPTVEPKPVPKSKSIVEPKLTTTK